MKKMHPILLSLVVLAARAEAQSLRVMSYNLQNLFDTVDNPSTNDEEFTPNGAQHWTETVLADKMHNLGEVIRSVKPDIIGVQEIENQEVLEQFVKTSLNGMGFKTVIAADSLDGRGIRPGLISRFPLVSQTSHRVSRPTWMERGQLKYGRDILEVTLDTGLAGDARYVTVLVNHWLSKAGGPVRDQWRQQEAESMAKIIADIAIANPARLVLAVGDFNDDYRSTPLQRGLPLVDSLKAFDSAPASMLYSPTSELPAGVGTHYFFPASQWNILDQMFMAEGDALKSGKTRGFHYDAGSVEIVRPRFQQSGGQPEGCEILIRRGGGSDNKSARGPRRNPRGGRHGHYESDALPDTDSGDDTSAGFRTRCLDGASDHFPVTATFSVR